MQIGPVSSVMCSLYRSVMVKQKLSCKAKFSIYQSICVPNITYGHKLWVVTIQVESLLLNIE